MNVLYELKDDWGQLYVYEDKVVIERKGFKAFLIYGLKGGKSIPITSLTSVQFKPAGKITTGHIQFGILGDIGHKGGHFSASVDENTIVFQKKNASVAEEIRAFLEQKIVENNSKSGNQSALSPADELKKYKDLLDQGIITQEEFDAKKKQLLGL